MHGCFAGLSRIVGLTDCNRCAMMNDKTLRRVREYMDALCGYRDQSGALDEPVSNPARVIGSGGVPVPESGLAITGEEQSSFLQD